MAIKKKAAVKKPAPKKIAPVVKKPQQAMVIDFSDEAKDLLKSLISALGKVSIGSAAPVAAASPAPAAPVKTTSSTTTTVSLTEIRELINEKAGQGKTAAIVKLLGNHGAQSASTLSEDNYAAFFTDLKEL